MATDVQSTESGTLRRNEDVFFVADFFIARNAPTDGQFGGFPQFIDAFDAFKKKQPQQCDSYRNGQSKQGVVADDFLFVWTGNANGTGLLDDACVGGDGHCMLLHLENFIFLQ